MTKSVEDALKRLKLAKAARKSQLTREQEALRFQVPELQWTDEQRKQREASEVGGVQIPPRPRLAIPKLNQPIQLVLNQQKNSFLGVNVSPINEEADDDTAEVINDLYRHEAQRGGADLARAWAFDRAVKAGFGAYRINTEYDEDSPDLSDQRIVWQRILHQDGVFFDPSAQAPDWSDGRYAFILSWVPWSTYVLEYGDSELAKNGQDGLKALSESEPEWVKLADEDDTTKDHAVLVAEYWRVEVTEEKTGPRPKRVRKVIWSVINGQEEVEGPQEWNGKYIPLIPVTGVELQPFDGERRWMGVIEPAMDAQRLFNYAASAAVELAALEPRAPWIMYEGQDEGYEDMWAQANIRNFPALKVNKDVVLANGQPAPLPQRAQADVGKLGPSMMLLERADQFLQASTTTLDQSRIEDMGRRRVAHQTIDALQQQSEVGNSHFLHALATVSMPYEAKVVLDLIPAIYDRPGRVVRLLSYEDDQRSVMLGQPFMADPNRKGRPVPAPQGHPKAKTFDLTKGRYGVTVTVGKSWQTRIQQGRDNFGELLAKDAALVPLLGPLYFKFADFPGAKEAAELLKKMRMRQFPGLDEDDESAVVAQAQQLQQENQAIKAQLQDAMQKIQTDFAKHSASIEVEKVRAQLEERLKVLDNAGKLAVAEVQARIKGIQIAQEAEHEATALGHQQAHELAMATVQQEHERGMAEDASARALAMGEQAHANAMQQGAQPMEQDGD